MASGQIFRESDTYEGFDIEPTTRVRCDNYVILSAAKDLGCPLPSEIPRCAQNHSNAARTPLLAIGSPGHREHLTKFRNLVAVVKSVRQHAQSQGLDFGDRFFTARTVGHDTWQVRDLRDPATVIFLLNFDLHW